MRLNVRILPRFRSRGRKGSTQNAPMMLRTTKALLIAGVAVFYSLVVLNNTTDYASNHVFVRHVLMMDSTFPGNGGMWRAINSPVLHTAFYLTIIAWELLTAVLCWWGAIRLLNARGRTSTEFERAKSVAVAGLSLGLFMWLFAFLAVGGEWFLMWQSKNWNGQEAAFRMFTVLGIVLLLVAQPDKETDPGSHGSTGARSSSARTDGHPQ
jgi:predicted small integral membrane protein